MGKPVTRIADIELEAILSRDRGWAAICFSGFCSIPCEHFRAEFEAFAREMQSVTCVEVVVEENPTITDKCGVTAVPTTLIMNGRQEVARYEGPYSREALLERVAALLRRA